MIYYPKKNTGPAAAVSIALYCGAALMFLISELGVPYRLVFQLAALVMLSFGIYFTSRYMLTDYKYVLKDIEKAPELWYNLVESSDMRFREYICIIFGGNDDIL